MILRNHTTMSLLKNKMLQLVTFWCTMTFLATRRTHYVMNLKHAWLIGTVLFFATKKAKRHAASDNTIQRVLLAAFTRSPAPFLKVTKTQHNKFCEPLSGIFALKKRTQN